MVHLDLTGGEILALLKLLIETIEADRYPMSPRIRLLQAILAKCGEVGGRPAFSRIASNTGARSPGEELMTCNTLALAVC